MKRLEPSWLHRKRGWQLGHAPPGWYITYCPGEERLTFDLGVWGFGAGLIAGLASLYDELGWFR